jgi:riboflavin kinase/FMN adenylyltransferase
MPAAMEAVSQGPLTFASMKVHRDLEQLPPFRNAVVTIGSFDGVHLGHQKIIRKVKDLAVATGGESIAITFHPHPRMIVYPKDQSLRLITTTEEKIERLARTGLDHLVIVPFSFEFSQLSADEYIQHFLVDRFRPRHIVIGYDHRFGMNRRGDIHYLRWHEQACGYKVVEIAKEEVDEMAVSSTLIRDSLDNGQVDKAAQLLGHHFSLRGRVVKGQQIGSGLGFPTANLEVEDKHKLIPCDGIYAAFATHEGERYQAMLYIGSRPTLRKQGHRSIEVHLFHFNKTIYGDELTVAFAERIRDDATLPDLEALRRQLEKDRARSLAVLQAAGTLLAQWEAREQPSVATVILNYNGRRFLERHLPSVLRTSYPNHRVYVADNGSKDDSLDFLRQRFPTVGIIPLAENHGFAEGYNRALAELEADYFVLLNSDVEVPADWLDPLVAVMENDRQVAVVQPKVRSLDQPDRFEYAGAAGGWIDFLGYPFCRGRIFQTVEQDRGQYDQVREIFWASGCCMAIRAPLYRGLGGFDKDFFAHQEEIDLCWRLKRAGYKIMYTPKSTVYHLGGGTLGYYVPYKAFLNFRNSYYTLLKNESPIRLAAILPLRLVLDTVAAVSFLAQGRFLHAQAVIGAFLSFFLALVTFIRKRWALEQLLDRIRISPQPNRQGILPRSIVLQYYLFRKKHFSDL